MSSSAVVDIDKIFEFWAGFAIDKRRQVLDQQAQSIANNKQDSVASRRALTEKTKTIRALPEAERAANTNALVKAYQLEIDKLTKRSNEAEEAFLALYQALAAAPDPCVAIEAATAQSKQASRVTELEYENKKLQKQLNEYREEHSELQNQEVTVARLRERVKALETDMEHMADERARAKESEVRAEAERTAHIYKDRDQVSPGVVVFLC
jgi:homeobox protein cut-like